MHLLRHHGDAVDEALLPLSRSREQRRYRVRFQILGHGQPDSTLEW